MCLLGGQSAPSILDAAPSEEAATTEAIMPSRLIPRSITFAIALLAAACGSENTAPDVPEPDNPTPGIISISPPEVEQGSAEVIITILGSDFVRSSVVRVNGSDRPTEYVSSTELHATLPSADFGAAGPVSIVVFNPAPGGGTSNLGSLLVRVQQNPVPVISALSPTFLTAGGAATEMTIEGTGFMPQSQVAIFGTFRAATYVSPTQLRVAVTETELAAGAVVGLRVLNPSPGGGPSNLMAFEIRTPVPVITSLAESQAIAGLGGYTLRVNGTGFLNASEVRFSGAPRETRRISATVLEATLLEGDLRAAGTFSITVTNPAPGGGASNAATFTLVNGVPSITVLPSQGATVGGSGFTLYVHGEGFVSGAVVRWNGANRPTQYVSGTRLTATISAADIAQAGVAQITVVNPTPGGGTSAAATMTIRQIGASTASERQVPLLGRDIAWDPSASRFYVSIKSSAPTIGNSVVAVDPVSGSVTGSVFVGSEPGKLALSHDWRVLYVGLDGASAVRRVDVPSLTPGLQWALPAGEVAGDLGVMPGFPNTVAVSRQKPGWSPPLQGVTIYDNGVARPTSSPGHTGGNRIEFLDSPTVLYGYNNAHTGFEFFTIGIDAAGARHVSSRGGLIGGFYTDIVGAAGRIYGTDGSIVDADQRTRVGSLGAATTLTVDPALGRAYLLNGSTIAVYDLNTFQLLGSVAIPTPTFDHPALVTPRLLRWGTDGIAVLDMTRLIIVQSPIFGP